MSKAFVEYNSEHFQQPRRNGATAADGGEFYNGLQPYKTNKEALENNLYTILNREFGESNIKQSEVPFYNSIKCNPQPIETIGEETPFTKFKRFWATIEERKIIQHVMPPC